MSSKITALVDKFWDWLDSRPKMKMLMFVIFVSRGIKFGLSFLKLAAYIVKRSQVRMEETLARKYLPVSEGASAQRRPPAYALITGGSMGIGFSLAKILARAGFNILIVSNDEQANATAEADLRRFAPKINVVTKTIDFLRDDYVKRIEEEVVPELYDVRVLVNSAGLPPQGDIRIPKEVTRIEDALHLFDIEEGQISQLQKCYAVNVVALAQITRWFLQRYGNSGRDSAKRAIVNLSSLSALVRTYHLSVYGSGKKIVLELSQQIAREYAGRGVDVIAATPGFVTTRLTHFRKEKFDIAPDDCARGILTDLCLGRRETLTHWKHWLAFNVLETAGSIFKPAYEFILTDDIKKFVINLIAKRDEEARKAAAASQ